MDQNWCKCRNMFGQ